MGINFFTCWIRIDGIELTKNVGWIGHCTRNIVSVSREWNDVLRHSFILVLLCICVIFFPIFFSSIRRVLFYSWNFSWERKCVIKENRANREFSSTDGESEWEKKSREVAETGLRATNEISTVFEGRSIVHTWHMRQHPITIMHSNTDTKSIRFRLSTYCILVAYPI